MPANPFTVPVTTAQHSWTALTMLVPTGYETSFAVGTTPQIQRPFNLTVFLGPSVTVRPPRCTVTVIGAPWLERISLETPSNVAALWPFTATTRSPSWRP